MGNFQDKQSNRPEMRSIADFPTNCAIYMRVCEKRPLAYDGYPFSDARCFLPTDIHYTKS